MLILSEFDTDLRFTPKISAEELFKHYLLCCASALNTHQSPK